MHAARRFGAPISHFEFTAATMHTGTSISVFLIMVVGFVVAIQELPSFLKICHCNDPNLSECVKESVNLLKPYLKSGIPELQIPSCEPLRVPQIEINQEAGPIGIKSRYTDIEIHGGTNFFLKSVKIDVNNDRVGLKLFFPHLEMIAHYNMNGKILLLPITGDGLAHGNWTDIDVIATIQSERYLSQKTNKIHLRVSDFYVDLKMGHVSIYLDNLFNGDSIMSDAMNLFLNNNWEVVAAEMKPALEQTISELFKAFSNKIYSKFPMDTLLPP